MVRKVLATKVNTRITITATFGGMHFPKGGNFIGRTILLTDIISFPEGELICNHMWAQTNEYVQYEQFKKGDIVRIIGTVIKYLKYNSIKPKKDFSIEIISCEKVG